MCVAVHRCRSLHGAKIRCGGNIVAKKVGVGLRVMMKPKGLVLTENKLGELAEEENQHQRYKGSSHGTKITTKSRGFDDDP